MSVSRRLLLGSALSLPLVGCGFRLRGSYTLPFETMYLDMESNTPFSGLLARQLRAGTNVRLVDDVKDAQAVLKVLANQRTRTIVALNTKGQAREFELRLKVIFRVSSPDGADYLPDTVLTAMRELSYNDDEYLTRHAEEAMLYDEMQTDIVAQMMRRIQHVRIPDKP